MHDGIWSGGTYSCWGTYNREAPLRMCGPEGHYHFEVKCVDATSTPHLAFAGLLGAGLRGILDGALLSTGDCEKPVALMNEEEKRAVGLANPLRLPRSIGDARKLFAADGVMQGIFGKEFIEKYIGTNEVSLALMTHGHRDSSAYRHWRSS